MNLSRRNVSYIALALLLGVFSVYAAHTAAWLNWIDWPKTFESIAHVAQTFGLGLGGWWTYRLFVKERHDRIRANVEHHVSSAIVSPSERVVRVLLEIQNAGSVLLQPRKASIRLDIVAPAEAPNLDKVRESKRTSEHNWPSLRTINLDFAADGFHLEPFEKERYSVDFLVPISTTAVQVHSVVDAPDNTYWDLATLHAVVDPENAVVRKRPNGGRELAAAPRLRLRREGRRQTPPIA